MADKVLGKYSQDNLQVSSNVHHNPFPKQLWFLILITGVFVYGLYPIYVTFSKVDNEIKYSTASLVLLIEFGKLIFSLIGLYPHWKNGQVKNQSLFVWLSFSVPAMLYCFNNNVAVLVQNYIDPASYMIIGNLKIPATAVLYRLIMKRSLAWEKWFAVSLLTAAGIFNSFGNLVSEESLKSHSNDVHVSLTGLIVLVVYCTVSAFAGIWSELIVKKQFELSIYQQNCMLYFFGVFFNLFAFLGLEVKSSYKSFQADISLLWKLKYFFRGFNIWVVVLVFSEVCGGLIVSAIMKYGSNITRLFVTSAAMVVTTLISYAFFDFHLNIYLIGSLCIVVFALYLYNRI